MIAPAWTALNMQPSDLRSDMQELVGAFFPLHSCDSTGTLESDFCSTILKPAHAKMLSKSIERKLLDTILLAAI